MSECQLPTPDTVTTTSGSDEQMRNRRESIAAVGQDRSAHCPRDVVVRACRYALLSQVTRHRLPFRVVGNKRSRNFAEAYNDGARWGRAKRLLSVSSDVRLPKTTSLSTRSPSPPLPRNDERV